MVLWIGFDLQADIETVGGNNSTALHYAAGYGKEAVAAQLLQAVASVSAVDNVYDQTPLHYAALNGKSSIANLLLQANASPTAVDKKTAKHRCSKQSSEVTETSRRGRWMQSKPES